jgi:hypothetical protein
MKPGGLQAFEFDASVLCCEAPIGDGVMSVSLLDPGGDLVGDPLFVGDAAIERCVGIHIGDVAI